MRILLPCRLFCRISFWRCHRRLLRLGSSSICLLIRRHHLGRGPLLVHLMVVLLLGCRCILCLLLLQPASRSLDTTSATTILRMRHHVCVLLIGGCLLLLSISCRCGPTTIVVVGVISGSEALMRWGLMLWGVLLLLLLMMLKLLLRLLRMHSGGCCGVLLLLLLLLRVASLLRLIAAIAAKHLKQRSQKRWCRS